MQSPVELKALQIAQGVSTQAAHERFPGQVSAANNVVFSLVDGFSKRPGSIHVAKLTARSSPSYSTGTNTVYRVHPINRDASEKYIAVYGQNFLKVYHTDGTECSVKENPAGTGAATAYYAMNSATASQLRFLSVADYTLIANTTVALGVTTTPTYTVTADWKDYDQMVAHTPTSTPFSTTVNTAGDGTYHKTSADSSGEPAGYYYYSVSGNTFPTMQFAEVTLSPSDWSSTATRGFNIRFQKRTDSFTGATFTNPGAGLNKTLTASSNVWSGYAHQAGDQIYISGGTGSTPGWYTILAKVSASSLTIDSSCPGTNGATNFAGAGIGRSYNVDFAGTGTTLATMHDVAEFVQSKMHSAGAKDALVEWVDTSAGKGYFVITSPWRGSGASIPSVTTNPTTSGSAPSVDLSSAGQAFSPTNSYRTAGSGSGPRTLPIAERWTRVAAPGDRDGSIDWTKAPIKMVRTSPPSSGTITNVSVANPTVITTSGDHGLENGQWVTIAGTNVTTSPGGGINGTFRATVLTDTTFQLYTTNIVAVNVTAVTTGTGTFTSSSLFTYDVIDWKNRTSGSDATNPSPPPFVNGLKISDMCFHRQRFGLSSGETVMFSAASDLFRFYLDDANNLVDTDPIVAPLSSDRITIIEYMVPVRDSLLVTTIAGKQFILGAPEVLSPSSVSFTEGMNIQSLRCRPCVMGPNVYIPASAGGKSQLREAYFIDGSVPDTSADVSAHIGGSAGNAGFLPSDIQTVVEHGNTGMVFMLPSPGSNVIYVYRAFWNGSRKEQSAWAKWTFSSSSRISDICVIDDFLYMVIEHQNQFALEKVPLFEPSIGNYPYNIHLDGQVELTGSYSNPTTTWTLPGSMSDTTINSIVLRTGATATVATAPGTTVTATGNYSSAAATLGRTYEMSVTLSEPFIRDQNGQAELASAMLLRQLVVRHINSGPYTITLDYETGTDSTFTFTPSSGYTVSAGQFSCWPGGDMSRDSIIISSSTATPVTIAGLTYIGEWGVRFHTGG